MSCTPFAWPGRSTLCLFAYSLLVYSGFLQDNMLTLWMRGVYFLKTFERESFIHRNLIFFFF